jgi:hypothetical protein
MAGAYLLEIRVGGVNVRLLSLRWLLWPVSCLAGLHRKFWQRETKEVTAVSIDEGREKAIRKFYVEDAVLDATLRAQGLASVGLLGSRPGEVIRYAPSQPVNFYRGLLGSAKPAEPYVPYDGGEVGLARSLAARVVADDDRIKAETEARRQRERERAAALHAKYHKGGENG